MVVPFTRADALQNSSGWKPTRFTTKGGTYLRQCGWSEGAVTQASYFTRFYSYFINQNIHVF